MEELEGPEKTDVKRRFPRGKEIQVEILSIGEDRRIRLSHKAIKEREDREDYKKFVENGGKGESLGTLGDIFKDLKLK
jgi:predicted RNA-binding protein with RPS1 domain